jgi:hypothetical protein
LLGDVRGGMSHLNDFEGGGFRHVLLAARGNDIMKFDSTDNANSVSVFVELDISFDRHGQ